LWVERNLKNEKIPRYAGEGGNERVRGTDVREKISSWGEKKIRSVEVRGYD